MKQIVTLLIALIVFNSCNKTEPIDVLATTSWTAAFAECAGAQNVISLAPTSLIHPSEYELQVNDIEKIKNAKFIVYAGYEILASELLEMVDTSKQTLIKINTSYNIDQLSSSVAAIAKQLKTEEIASKNISSITSKIDSFKQIILTYENEKRQVCSHFFQQDIINELGLDLINIFGPQPLEAYDFKKLNEPATDLIIDNIHNPIGAPLEEILKVKRIELVNFPGTNGTRSLEDVINYNFMKIKKAIRK